MIDLSLKSKSKGLDYLYNNDYFILDLQDKEVVKATYKETVAFRKVKDSRAIGRDKYKDVVVSTCFFCEEVAPKVDGKPVLFETIVFQGDIDRYIERFTSYNDAVQGHARILELVKKAYKKG